MEPSKTANPRAADKSEKGADRQWTGSAFMLEVEMIRLLDGLY